MSQAIYDHAKKDLGLKEVPGPKSAPRIALAIETAAKWLDRDDSETPWCGCIRGLWGLETGTGVPKEHFRAFSWSVWGYPVQQRGAKQGDTVVLKRSGGHHVGLLDHFSEDGKKVFLLGGNQSNAVTIAPFAVESIVSIRRDR